MERPVQERHLMEALKVIRKQRRKKSQQKAQRKYHKRAFAVVSAKVKIAESNKFKELCAMENMTRHEVIKLYVERANDMNSVFFWE